MDPASFKAALGKAKPDMASLLELGLERSEAIEIMSSFDVIERDAAEAFPLPDPTLSELFSQNDLSHVEIGMVRFRRDPAKVANGWVIGEVESDYLTIHTNSGEIVVMDVTSPDHMTWRCARDGSSFLGALAFAAEYFGECMATEQILTLRRQDTLLKCTELAGGDDYHSFYKMLLAAD